MKKLISLFVSVAFVIGLGALPAAAAQVSPRDSYTPYWSYNEFDVEFVSFEKSVIPGRLDFYVEVAGPISSYSYTLGDYVGVAIDANNDGDGDYYMWVDENYFDGAYGVPIDVWDARNSRFLPSCDAEFWLANDYTVGFDLIESCLGLPSTFGIMGLAYTSYWDELDLVPDYGFHSVSNTGSSNNPALDQSSKTAANPPTIRTKSHYRVANPGSAPDDLVTLAANVGKSVVTLYCGNSQGTGWSAKVDLSSTMKNSGVKSYLITNHHVVDGCLSGEQVTIISSTGANYTGVVVGYDQEKDVAALTTTASIPGLEWTGEKPAVGWWAGVIGSPFNNSGTLSTGIVSSIVDKDLITTAPLNPGNSGGPVFDRTGRVVGVATAILDGSNLIGFAGSIEHLCGVLVSCSSLNPWIPAANLTSAPEQAVNTGAQGPESGEFSAWTKVLANGKQMKFYVKYPQVGDKIQFMVQDNKGVYKQFAWVRIESDDLDSEGNYMGLTNDIYFIRTMNLNPGKNRVRILVNGELYWGTKTYSGG